MAFLQHNPNRTRDKRKLRRIGRWKQPIEVRREQENMESDETDNKERYTKPAASFCLMGSGIELSTSEGDGVTDISP